MNIRIFPPEEILETTITHLPVSKSVAARDIVMRALTPGVDEMPAPECNDDIDVIRHNVAIRNGSVNVGRSGTAMRFVTAYFAAKEGCKVTIDGDEQVRRRPIAPLIDALRALGADIEYVEESGRLPINVIGRRLDGGHVAVSSRLSSQFVSALCIIAPTMKEPLSIDMGGQLPSMPYIQMTLEMLRRRGVEADIEGYTIHVANTPYRAVAPAVEADWSSAAAWYAIAAASAGWVTIPGLRRDSLQGDRILASLGERIGVVTEFTSEGVELSATPDIYSRLDLDMADNPDLVPSLAVAAALIGIPFEFTGVANLRHKESDRIASIADNLRRLGVVTTQSEDILGWEGEREPITQIPEIDPQGDHRIAMAFAAASVFVPGIVIRDAGCVSKSYPGFFEDMAAAGFTIVDADAPMPSPEQE